MEVVFTHFNAHFCLREDRGSSTPKKSRTTLGFQEPLVVLQVLHQAEPSQVGDVIPSRQPSLGHFGHVTEPS